MTHSNFNDSIEFFKTHGYADDQSAEYINAFYAHFGLFLAASLEDQYRLCRHGEDGFDCCIAEDPASGDTYDKESAAVIFYESALQYIIGNR